MEVATAPHPHPHRRSGAPQGRAGPGPGRRPCGRAFGWVVRGEEVSGCFCLFPCLSPSVIYLRWWVGGGGYLADLRCAGSSSVDAPRRGGRRRGQMFVFLFSGRGAGRGPASNWPIRSTIVLSSYALGYYTLLGRVVYSRVSFGTRARPRGWIPSPHSDRRGSRP